MRGVRECIEGDNLLLGGFRCFVRRFDGIGETLNVLQDLYLKYNQFLGYFKQFKSLLYYIESYISVLF
jgi:hypothetical protein